MRAIVVGPGHNGLVCASYLARAGLDVLVLEQSARPGGGSRTAPLGGVSGLRGRAAASVVLQDAARFTPVMRGTR